MPSDYPLRCPAVLDIINGHAICCNQSPNHDGPHTSKGWQPVTESEIEMLLGEKDDDLREQNRKLWEINRDNAAEIAYLRQLLARDRGAS